MPLRSSSTTSRSRCGSTRCATTRRYVVAIEARYQRERSTLLAVLIRALRRFGAPDAMYFDNGATYRGDALVADGLRRGLEIRPFGSRLPASTAVGCCTPTPALAIAQMTPDQAVDQLATIVAGDVELSADDIYEAMAKAEVPDDVADRAYKFTQIAWGRLFLGGLGLTFPPDYFCLNASGDIIESGLLEDEPFFVAAVRQATDRGRSKGFARFAAMSADVSAINSALHAGSKPEVL